MPACATSASCADILFPHFMAPSAGSCLMSLTAVSAALAPARVPFVFGLISVQ